MRKWCKILMMIFALAMYNITFAQAENARVDNMMRSEGKIYVVLAVVLTIFAGLLFYLVRLDRKITRLEKENV